MIIYFLGSTHNNDSICQYNSDFAFYHVQRDFSECFNLLKSFHLVVECDGKYIPFFAFHRIPSVSVHVRLLTELGIILQ